MVNHTENRTKMPKHNKSKQDEIDECAKINEDAEKVKEDFLHDIKKLYNLDFDEEFSSIKNEEEYHQKFKEYNRILCLVGVRANVIAFVREKIIDQMIDLQQAYKRVHIEEDDFDEPDTSKSKQAVRKAFDSDFVNDSDDNIEVDDVANDVDDVDASDNEVEVDVYEVEQKPSHKNTKPVAKSKVGKKEVKAKVEKEVKPKSKAVSAKTTQSAKKDIETSKTVKKGTKKDPKKK